MKARLIVFPAFLALLLFALAGCNFLGWTSSESAASLIDEGNELMRDADYSAAVEKFAQAMELDPSLSDARYYHSKAVMREAGFNGLTLVTTMADEEIDNGSKLPFSAGEWQENEREKANCLFGAVRIVYEDLRPIFRNETHGTFNSVDIDLDYAIVTGIQGILMFQDTNNDGVIDENDFNLNIIFDFDDDTFEIENWQDFVNEIGTENADQLLDNIEELIITSSDVLVDIIDSMDEDSGINVEDVDELVDEILELINEYR